MNLQKTRPRLDPDRIKKFNRNTKYNNEFHPDAAFYILSQGHGHSSVCAEFEIDKDTMVEWQKIHTDFAAAIKKGTEASQAWWEELAKEHQVTEQGPGDPKVTFNTTNYQFTMRSRFRVVEPTAVTLNVNADAEAIPDQLQEVINNLTRGTI